MKSVKYITSCLVEAIKESKKEEKDKLAEAASVESVKAEGSEELAGGDKSAS